MWPIMCKYDVTHRTGRTQRIASSPDYNRTMTVGDRHERYGKDRTYISGNMLADRHTNRQDKHTDVLITILRPLPYCRQNKNTDTVEN